jgi:hypothetical protein
MAMAPLGAVETGRASFNRVSHARNQVMESLIILLWSDMKQKKNTAFFGTSLLFLGIILIKS